MNNLWTDDFDSRYIVRRGAEEKEADWRKRNQSDLKETEQKMKFDEEDLLDLINGPLNGPAKEQKDNEISKNYLLSNEINREQDIISVSSKQFFFIFA